MDDSLRTARFLLVGSAVFAGVVALVLGQWFVAGVLLTGVVIHGVHLWREGVARRGADAPAAGGVPPRVDF